MNKLLSIHEDSQSNEQVGGGRGGQAAQVGRDEEGGRDRHQAGGHQLDGRVFFSWAGKMLIEQISNLNSATNSCLGKGAQKREKKYGILTNSSFYHLRPWRQAWLKPSRPPSPRLEVRNLEFDFIILIIWYCEI